MRGAIGEVTESWGSIPAEGGGSASFFQASNVEDIHQNLFLIALYSLDLGTSGIFCFSVSSLVMFSWSLKMLLDQMQLLLRCWATHLRCEPYSFCLQTFPEFVIRSRALLWAMLRYNILISIYILTLCLLFVFLKNYPEWTWDMIFYFLFKYIYNAGTFSYSLLKHHKI